MPRNKVKRKRMVRNKKGRRKPLYTIRVGLKYEAVDNRVGFDSNFYETLIGPSNVPVSGSVTDLCLIPQGISREERIFDFVYLKKVQLRYNLVTQNADIFNSARVAFIMWKPNSVPNYASFYQNGSTTVYPFYQFDNAQEYKVMYDKIHSMSGTATNPTPSGNVIRTLIATFRGKGLPLKFVAGTTAGTNHIYLVMSGDSALTPFPQIIVNVRLIFKNFK